MRVGVVSTSRTTPVDDDTVAHRAQYVGVVSANATGPTSARRDYTLSYWRAVQAAQQRFMAQ